MKTTTRKQTKRATQKAAPRTAPPRKQAREKASPDTAIPEAAARLNALLHTMRCIAQHEDALCTLLHQLRQAGSLSPDLREELRTLLDELPSDEYLRDLDTLAALLHPVPPA